jgi:hypothetical protein
VFQSMMYDPVTNELLITAGEEINEKAALA